MFCVQRMKLWVQGQEGGLIQLGGQQTMGEECWRMSMANEPIFMTSSAWSGPGGDWGPLNEHKERRRCSSVM